MLDQDEALLLDAEGWLREYENAEAGEEISAPLGIVPFVRGRTATLGAETGVGKTVFGLMAFRWVVEQGHRSAYLNLEMTPRDLLGRFSNQFDSHEACLEWINQYEDMIYVSRPYIDDHEVEQIIRKQGPFDFVVLDHIHELPFDGHEDLGRKVRRIASLASATDTALLMLSQMKQKDDYSMGEPPSKRDFSWTKAISEVSSQLYAIWLPDSDDPYTAELICLKNRFGPKTNAQRLKLNPVHAVFTTGYDYQVDLSPVGGVPASLIATLIQEWIGEYGPTYPLYGAETKRNDISGSVRPLMASTELPHARILAELAGVSKKTVTRIINGEVETVSVDVTDKLLSSMGKTDAWFCELYEFYIQGLQLSWRTVVLA